jgi:hypothetical protein
MVAYYTAHSMEPKEDEVQENVIKRIDLIIRALSQSKMEMNDSEDIQKIKAGVEQDDKPRLAALLEDTLVLLKDNPHNRLKIKENLNRIWDGYGHIKPLSEVVDQVKKSYLASSSTSSGSSST